MPIERPDLFDDETIGLLTEVYAAALRQLSLDGYDIAPIQRDDGPKSLCHRIVELAVAGERDPQILLHQALASLISKV
jgi:hypothetical protein